MSQYKHTTTYQGKLVVILIGWDRPMKGFFMVIDFEDNETDDYIYTNLDDPELKKTHGLSPSWTHFNNKLKELGLSVPEEIFNNACRDRDTD